MGPYRRQVVRDRARAWADSSRRRKSISRLSKRSCATTGASSLAMKCRPDGAVPAASGSGSSKSVGGFITPPKEYFQIVEKIVRNHGGIFISDEVQTGWGRTGGKWFGIE